MQQKIQPIVDASAVGILAGVWANILPVFVSLVTLVWFLIKIYETQTVQHLINSVKKKNK